MTKELLSEYNTFRVNNLINILFLFVASHCSRVVRGNLVVKHSRPQFLFNFRDIVWTDDFQRHAIT